MSDHLDDINEIRHAEIRYNVLTQQRAELGETILRLRAQRDVVSMTPEQRRRELHTV